MAYQPITNPLPVQDASLARIMDLLQMVCNRLDAINMTLAHLANQNAQSIIPGSLGNSAFYIDPDDVAAGNTQIQ